MHVYVKNSTIKHVQTLLSEMDKWNQKVCFSKKSLLENLELVPIENTFLIPNLTPHCLKIAPQHIFDFHSSLSKGIVHLIWNVSALLWTRLAPMGAECEIDSTYTVLIKGQASPLGTQTQDCSIKLPSLFFLSLTHIQSKRWQTQGSHCFDFLPDQLFPVQ